MGRFDGICHTGELASKRRHAWLMPQLRSAGGILCSGRRMRDIVQKAVAGEHTPRLASR